MRILITIFVALALQAGVVLAADAAPQVTLNASKVTPRALESLTQRALVRDYGFAWQNLAQALATNSSVPLNGLFVGNANTWLKDKVNSQRRNGLSARYSNQSHRVDAVFYSPEGDVIELHDTAEYDYQIMDGGKSIHSEHAIVRYVVLMTPGADRWVVRQIQSVQQF